MTREIIHPHSSRAELDYFNKRIISKIAAYTNSPLTPTHDHLLKTFFDLAQQYASLDSFYQICVAIPQALDGQMTTSLTLLNQNKKQLQLVCSSGSDLSTLNATLSAHTLPNLKPSYIQHDYLILPILSQLDQKTPHGEASVPINEPSSLGFLIIENHQNLTDIDRLFLEKLATRIGYNLQHRLLEVNHLDHVNFLKQLGRDIGHNVITPNMHFKNLFRQLERKINLIDEEAKAFAGKVGTGDLQIIERCNEIRAELIASHEELLGHYNRTSLYMETLLREEHFSKGKFVLKARYCQVEDDIIIPELEIYRKRIERQGITIDQPHNMRGRPFYLKGDLGLLSQVFDNLFSNATKYTTETIDSHGNPRKSIAYGCQEVDNFPTKGEKGVKFNLFCTGEHLGVTERLTIFNDGVRGLNVGQNPGSGHGLAFVRNVVEIHGGTVGYESVPGGNNFYFILPMASEQDRNR